MPDFYLGTPMLPTKKTFAACGLTKEMIQKACYQTQAMRDYPGRAPSQEAAGENFTEVHGIGQRDSKYMPFDINRAPLLNRQATRSSDYHPHPLGDNIVNKALAENFKGGFAAGKGSNPCPMDGHSLYEGSYTGQSREDLARARQANQKPPFVFTHTVCPPGEMMVKKSSVQENFGKPDPRFQTVAAEQPMAGLYLPGAPKDVPRKTTTRHLHSLQAVRVARSASTPQLGLTPLPPIHPDILSKPRNAYMEAGK